MVAMVLEVFQSRAPCSWDPQMDFGACVWLGVCVLGFCRDSDMWIHSSRPPKGVCGTPNQLNPFISIGNLLFAGLLGVRGQWRKPWSASRLMAGRGWPSLSHT